MVTTITLSTSAETVKFFHKILSSTGTGLPRLQNASIFFFLSDADKMKWERFPICQDSEPPKSNGTEPRTWAKPATGEWCLQPVLEAGRTPKPSSDWPPPPALIPVLGFRSALETITSSLFYRCLCKGFQVALMVKNPPDNAGDIKDTSLILGSETSPGEGHGNPLQSSCLEHPMDRGAWRATIGSIGSLRVMHYWSDLPCMQHFLKMLLSLL